MTAFQIADAIQSLGPMTYVRESGYTYPMIMATHLSCIAVFGGLILMTDLRLMGVALKDISVSDVVRGTRPWKYLGFVIMITMGLLLGTSEADKYYNNPYFLLKMALLFSVAIHAIAFRSVYKNPEAFDRSAQMPGIAKAAGIVSLCIWIGIASCGRWIAYYEPPKAGKNRPPVSMIFIPGDPGGNHAR